MQDRYVAFNDGCLTRDKASCVVEQNAMSDLGCRMDVDRESFRDETLKVERKLHTPSIPQVMRYSVAD